MGLAGFNRARRMAAQAAGQAIDEKAEVPNAPEQKQKQQPAGPALADMTVKELRALAADKGIALGRELTTKADILAAVETALGESSAHSSSL